MGSSQSKTDDFAPSTTEKGSGKMIVGEDISFTIFTSNQNNNRKANKATKANSSSTQLNMGTQQSKEEPKEEPKEEKFKLTLDKNLVSIYPPPQTPVFKTGSRELTKSTTQNKEPKEEKFKLTLDKNLVSIYPPPQTPVFKTGSREPTKSTTQNFQTMELDAKPVEEQSQNMVTASDGRNKILETGKWPYSVHGLVAMKFNQISCYGTGIMIGPNIVLTAGHNLYDKKRKLYAELTGMQFMPGMSGKVLPFGAIEVKQYFVSPNYIKEDEEDEEDKEDYGLLILKESIGKETGYFGLACLEPEEIKTKRINVTGYPYDKVDPTLNIHEMWGMEGEAAHIDQNRGLINYLINTGKGQSGSGVWYQEGEDFYICGVHVLGTNFVNKATLLTKAIYKQIDVWTQQTSGKKILPELGELKRLQFIDIEITPRYLSRLIGRKLNDLNILDLRSQKIDKKGAEILAKDTSWTNLSQLYLDRNNLGAEGAEALAKNTSWINLSKLNLLSNNLDAKGIKALEKNIWTNLSWLDLSYNRIGEEGVKILAENRSWPNLSELYLIRNDIGAEGIKALAESTSWPELVKLDLSENIIRFERVQLLAQNTSWKNLSWLNLSRNCIGAKGAKELAQNDSWRKLSYLNLSENSLCTEGAKELIRNTSWIKLSHLDLSCNSLRAEGAKELAQNDSWIKLSNLNLSENSLGPEGAKALAQNISWIKLSHLNLSYNSLGTEGAKGLAQNVSWKNLSYLILSPSGEIRTEGVKALARNASWKNLSHLKIDWKAFTPEEIEALKQDKA